MKLPDTTHSNTVGLNTMSMVGLVLLAAVCWSQISPWWLLASIPTLYIGFGLEIHLKRQQSMNL